MDLKGVIRVLFAAAPLDGLVEVRRVPANGHPALLLDPVEPELPSQAELQNGSNWFFGTVLRTTQRDLHSASLVWCDIDAKDNPDLPEASAVFPRPTLATNSGGGLHLYWSLTEVVTPEQAVQASCLAAMVFGGDRNVLEAHRVMRLPGSLNQKYSPPKPCEVIFSSDVMWKHEELVTAFAAKIASNYWIEGDRHQMALALSAVLARAGWSVERMQECMTLVCTFADDVDVSDRRTCAWSTFQRYNDGKHVDSRAWREALGDEDFKLFLRGLGVSTRDGELVYRGESIGLVSFLEQSLVTSFLNIGDWAMAEGTPFHWTGSMWEAADKDKLRAATFDYIKEVAYVEEGEERLLAATNKLASALAGIIVGQLPPLPEPPPGLLPCRNGILDLESLELRPVLREDYFRWTLGAEYLPEAVCPRWLAFLAEAAPNEVGYLQEWLGYCLTPGNPWQRMLWLYGQSGTGKSTFLTVVGSLFGSAAVAVRPDNLSDYALAGLGSARIATCSEIGDRTLRTALLKSLIASDKVTARHPYGRPFDLVFRGKFIWGSNTLPPVDQAEGMWRRLGIIGWDNVPTKRIVALEDRLIEELPGILNWCLEGLTRVNTYTSESEWPLPQAMADKVHEYQIAADTFGMFVGDELELGSTLSLPLRELYFRYSAWAKEHGHRVEPLGPIFRREAARFNIRPAAQPTEINGRLVQLWEGAQLRPDVFTGNQM